MKPYSNSKWGHKRSCLGMSVYILSLSLLLLFSKWVQTSYDIVQESIKSYMSSSNQKKKDILLTVHTSSPLTFIISAKKKKNQVSKILKTKYTALLHRGALINCSPASLKACSQFQLIHNYFNSNHRSMCCLQEGKKTGRGK